MKNKNKKTEDVLEIKFDLCIEKGGKRYIAHSPTLTITASGKVLRKLQNELKRAKNITKVLGGLGWSYSVFPKQHEMSRLMKI